MAKTLWYQTKGKIKNPLVERFQSSYAVDRHLADEDITGSIAYASALKDTGVLSRKEMMNIQKHLLGINRDCFANARNDRNGGVIARSRATKQSDSYEDIHTAVETSLAGKMGAKAGKIHTGRSRNEQVVLDERLYLKKEILLIQDEITRLQAVLVKSAQKYIGVIMPGYTHLQQAQPILFSFYLMNWFFGLERDKQRLSDCYKRLDICPLGSGALAGNAYNINRHKLAKQLGFAASSENALDAVSDRDFIIETLADSAILMMHLSRLCEDLIIWSSAEFGFIRLAEGLATSSSLMPQKHNPDALELIRGKTGRVYGNLVNLLTVMKGLPTGYNKDMQEDKEPLFDTVQTTGECLQILTLAIKTMQIFPERMKGAINEFTLATDIADYLVKKGVPFRQSHHIISKLVRYASHGALGTSAVGQGKSLSSLGINEFQRFSPLFNKDIYNLLEPFKSIESKKTYGGTATRMVKKQIAIAKRLISKRI